jgi:hypothetical protein
VPIKQNGPVSANDAVLIFASFVDRHHDGVTASSVAAHEKRTKTPTTFLSR